MSILWKSLKDQFKGMMTASFARSVNSPSGDEYYVVETFWSRVEEAVRNDVVSIYDLAVAVVDEISVPSPNLSMPKRSNTGLIAPIPGDL